MVQGQVQQALSALTERERMVVTLHFGLDQQGTRTYAEIGRMIGVCRERVRQILSSALEKLAYEPVLQSLSPAFAETATENGWERSSDEDS